MTTVAVIGGGIMGTGIVSCLLKSDSIKTIKWQVSSKEKKEKVEACLSNIQRFLKKEATNGRISHEQVHLASSKLHIFKDHSEIEDCDLIIEAVTENKEIKEQVFLQLAKHMGKNTILASNTSSLSIDLLAGSIGKEENFIGLHFFNPAPLMSLVEIVQGTRTSEQTLDYACNFITSLGKQFVITKNSPGFIVNRLLIPMINEAIGLLAEGVADATSIDKAMKLGANHPIGPLTLSDLIGNDVVLAILDVMRHDTQNHKYEAHPLLRQMVVSGQLGRKVKKGFFEY